MSGQFTEDYRIPDSLVGLVIGRGGEQIKRMQQDGDGIQERTYLRISGVHRQRQENAGRRGAAVQSRQQGGFGENQGGFDRC